MNTFGHNFKITIFGESHGKQVGVVIDGLPAGIVLNESDFINDLERRNPDLIATTTRKEIDNVEILSGVFENKTTGCPLTLVLNNKNIRHKDYNKEKKRPSHADFVASVKFNNYNDFRGGGMFSGRMTAPLVVAGVIAKKVITHANTNIAIHSHIIGIGGIKCDNDLSPQIIDLIENTIKTGDTLGGIIECRIKNMPIGVGNPFFNSIESILSHIIFSVPGVVGIEFGDGFEIANQKGSQVNDVYINKEGQTATNHFGGINGGISNGNDIVFRVAIRPPASIRFPQMTFNFEKNIIDEQIIEGRHDVCFALRSSVIIEAVSAIAIVDLLLST